MIAFVQKEWENIPYPNFPCPLDLLLAIIHVNTRRSPTPLAPTTTTSPTPEEILAQITDFDPQAWAAARSADLKEEWGLLLGRIYQSATFLFAVSTLTPQFTLLTPHDLAKLAAVHRTRLVFYLRQAEPCLPVIRSCLWPVVVAGVAVAPGDVSAREFVLGALRRVADELAAASLLEVGGLFEGFWGSGRREWDKCFDRPYAIVQ